MNRIRQFGLSVFVFLTLSSLATTTQAIHGFPKHAASPPATDSQVLESSADEEEKKDEIPTIANRTRELDKQEGFLPFWFDHKSGQILLELKQFEQEFLYVHALATGLGSNPIGLDRGQLGDQKVVRFVRVGPKVLLMQRNLRFRADSDNLAERHAVNQSFAHSVIWGGKVEAEDENGDVLVDLTSLLMSDVHGVIDTLSRTEQGEFQIDESRSAVFLPRCKAFPRNTELETTLTFTSAKPGPLVSQTAPTPNSVSLRQHHSFIELPDDRYRPRKYNVRCPSIHITFADYAVPIDQPLDQRWIIRHRLERKDPDASTSPAVEPIVYYVDPGAPQPIRDALIDGASWWNDAFAAAGFENAFQVKVLPEAADPLDVRYNVIQWVHRSTRGWSYGGSIIDPRTGEIIKGHVSLGSLRVRQDRLLAAGLSEALPAPTGKLNCGCCGIGSVPAETPLATLAAKADPVEVALARIRQLSAHEVGHTLGFVHNFAASTYGDRASVMDYPAPRIKIGADNQLDLSDAYAVGIGEWDKVSVQFAYSQFPEGVDESLVLNRILDNAAKKGMIFLTDADARPAGAAHPLANLWDNGQNPVDELNHVLKVRRIALDQFSPNKLPQEIASADVEQYLVPIYLHHRYQIQATAKLIGGVTYDYGDVAVQTSPRPVNFADQLVAARTILNSMSPEQLAINKRIVNSIGVKPYRQLRDQESFPRNTGRTFDPLAAARVAADMAISELLQHERLARFAQQSTELQNMDLQRFIVVVADIVWAWEQNARTETEQQLSRVSRRSVVEQLMKLVDHKQASPEVKDAALSCLYHIETTCQAGLKASRNTSETAFLNYLLREIGQIIERPYLEASPPESIPAPPGSPIGGK